MLRYRHSMKNIGILIISNGGNKLKHCQRVAVPRFHYL